MDRSQFLQEAPSLDPRWLQYEKESGLLEPQPVYANIKDRQPVYSQACKKRNAGMLTGRDKYLTENISIADSTLAGSDGRHISIRSYSPTLGQPSDLLIIYYHGGGLRVGDLDSEDLSCRKICIDASVRVISVDYRLMPDHRPAAAVDDAYEAFLQIIAGEDSLRKLVLVGSSSGGQLAAQVSQRARGSAAPVSKAIDGLLLRCPVTVDAGEGGKHIPARFRGLHHSFKEQFHTSLLRIDGNSQLEKAPDLPLDAEVFSRLPRAFIQVCTNDIYYSDGVCYAKALEEAGVDVRLDVIRGWPHTFWLKAPELDRGLEAENEMIKGLKWLLS